MKNVTNENIQATDNVKKDINTAIWELLCITYANWIK